MPGHGLRDDRCLLPLETVFTPRRFVAALVIAAALLPPPPTVSAVDEPSPKKSPAKTQRNSHSKPSAIQKKSPSPSSSPKKTSSTSSNSAASSGETSDKKTGTSSQSASSKKKAKKTKAKPKSATQKRRPKTEAEPEKRRMEPESEKKPEPTPRPAPQPAPQPSSVSRTEAAQTRASGEKDYSVIVTKSGIVEEEEPPPAVEQEESRWWWPFGGGPRYKYLTRSVRQAIDDARVARHRWRYIVVHNSGTRQGNAKAFDYYHRRVRKMPNGLAYHFVIGNGTSSGNGAVEIGPRWVNQITGGHVHSDYLNSIALGICLVGDYNREKPTREQLEALDELVKYLRKRVGKTDHKLAVVKPHRDINPPQWPTDCPGDRFPYHWLNSKFED